MYRSRVLPCFELVRFELVRDDTSEITLKSLVIVGTTPVTAAIVVPFCRFWPREPIKEKVRARVASVTDLSTLLVSMNSTPPVTKRAEFVKTEFMCATMSLLVTFAQLEIGLQIKQT